MAWQNANLTRTLRIIKTTRGGKTRYTLDPMIHVQRAPGGETYLEPQSFGMGLGCGKETTTHRYAFDNVEFVDESAYSRKYGDATSQMSLTKIGLPAAFATE